jgi:predicted PurR-regulated permease PerM
VRIFDDRTARVLATVLLYGLALGFIALAWKTLVTFIFAILFAYLFEPVVTRFEQRLHIGRGWAVLLLYLILTVSIGGSLFVLGPRIVQQAERLAKIAPTFSSKLASGQLMHQLGARYGWSGTTQQRVQHFLASHQEQIADWEKMLEADLGSLAGNLAWAALVPIIAVFFLMASGRFAEAFVEQWGRRQQRQFARGLLEDAHDVMAHYIRSQIILAAIGTVAYVVGFELLRVPYAIGLGVIAGVLEFIPILGPLLGAAIVLGTAVFLNYHLILGLALFLGAFRLEQDYVNSPHIMGGQVQLHPLAVLFGALAGAEVAGLIGVYLSVPAMAILRLAWLRWRAFQNVTVAPPGQGGSGPVITPP